MTVRILTGVEPRHEALVARHLASLPGVELVRRCPDLADLVAAASAGLADAAIVSAGLRGIDRDTLGHLRDCGVVAVGLVDDEEQERRLRQLGVAATVPADCTAEEIDAVLTRSLGRGSAEAGAVSDEEWAALEAGLDPAGAPAPPDTQDPRERAGRGRLVVVWGPAGAPGRTSVAINLAGELALTGRSVLLIDADTYGASIGQALGLLDEAPGLAAAARAAELGTLDVPTLARLSPVVEPGFRVLTGLPSASRWPEVRADSMGHLLDLARALSQVVVVDIGFCLEDDEELSYDTRAPRRNAVAVTTLAEANAVVAVGAGDPVGLQRLVRALPDVQAVSPRVPTVVINKVRAGVAGASPAKRICEALDRFAAVSVEHTIPEDQGAFDKALLAGRLLSDVAPKSAARSRIRDIALAVAPDRAVAVAPAAAGARQGKGSFGRLAAVRPSWRQGTS